LVVAQLQAGEIFEPITAGYGSTGTRNIWGNTMERLLAREPSVDGVGKVIPALAESWKVSEDGALIEFTLRQGVKFHTGDPMTAKDVVFSFEFTRGNTFNAAFIQMVESVEAVDDYHVNLHIGQYDARFLLNLARVPIESKAYYDRVGEEEFIRNPVGTGPYKLVEVKPGEYADLEAFEDYWGEVPEIKEVRIRIAPEDTTRIAMLKTGEVDIINGVPYPMIEDVNNTEGLKVIEGSRDGSTCHVRFQHANPESPWNDIRVRQAIAYAIDYDAINDSLNYGYTTRYAGLAPWDIGYDPELKPFEYNPEKAKELLAEAGYAPGEVAFDFNYMSGEFYGVKEVAEAVVLYLNEVGMNTTAVGWPAPKWAEWAVGARGLDGKGDPEKDFVNMGVSGFAGQPDSMGHLIDHYIMSSIFCNCYDEDVDNLLTTALRTVDDAERGELIAEVYRLLHERCEYIPIFTQGNFYGMKDNISFVPTSFGGNSDRILFRDVEIE
jgi:peptide/nickel transport system substrate-binding protein